MYESDNKNVNPQHYQQGGMQAIDIIEAFTKDLKGVEAFCAGNAIKYILRFSHKNGVEDIEKAIWYLTHLKEHITKESSSILEKRTLDFDEGKHIPLPEERNNNEKV